MATRVNRAGLDRLRQRLTAVALAGAQGGAGVLAEKLSGPGSGRHHAGLPNRSSAEGEYPAEQEGDLLGSIDARPAGEGAALFGPINNPPDHLHALHSRSPDMGGRPFMDDARHDRDIHRAIVEGIEQEARAQFGQATVRRTT